MIGRPRRVEGIGANPKMSCRLHVRTGQSLRRQFANNPSGLAALRALQFVHGLNLNLYGPKATDEPMPNQLPLGLIKTVRYYDANANPIERFLNHLPRFDVG